MRALPPTATTMRTALSFLLQGGLRFLSYMHSPGAAVGFSHRFGRGVLRRVHDPIRSQPFVSIPWGGHVAKSDVIQRPDKGTELFDTSEKVFPDVKAEPGESAYTFMHPVPYEGSVG